MIPYEEALEIVLGHCARLDTESVPIEASLGRVLAEPLIATADLPRFDCSAVDGYALHVPEDESSQSGAEYEVTGIMRAGHNCDTAVSSSTAVQVLTGARIPAGTNSVVMNEQITRIEDRIRVWSAPAVGENIRWKGEEYRLGDQALLAGSKLNPAGIGLAVSLGYQKLSVYQRPRMRLVTTGDEVVPLGTPLEEGQIYNANQCALSAALLEAGFRRVPHFHVQDDLHATLEVLNSTLSRCDVLLTTGGVSVGETDFVKVAMQELGFTIHFTSVAIKPGKPTCFGNRGRQLWFGLPGNPVAALLSFQKFVIPALASMTGETEGSLIRTSARLKESIQKKSGRAEFVRGNAYRENGTLSVKPSHSRESHMLGGLAQANALIHFPAHSEWCAAGEFVEIELLRS